MTTRAIISLLLLFSWCHASEMLLTEVDQLRKDFWTMEHDIFRRIGVISTKNVTPLKLDGVISKFKKFDDEIFKVGGRRQSFFQTNEIDVIGRMYVIYKRVQRSGHWVNFARAVLNLASMDIQEQLRKLNEFVAERQGLRRIFEEMNADVVCSTRRSKRDVLYSYYEAVAITEIKGYALLQFSQTVLHLSNKGNYTTALLGTRRRFKQQSLATVNAVLDVLKIANGELRRCDPETHKSNETYVEVTNLLQGYIANEVDLNKDKSCLNSCPAFTNTEMYLPCLDGVVCKQQRSCYGKVLNCRSVDSNMDVCPSKSKNRRYDYIKYDTGTALGRIGKCQKQKFRATGWWRWTVHCSNCLCVCDQQMDSDRIISLRAAKSNIDDNRVVTGMRFVKVNRIIHLQVQEGKLMPRGTIDANTSRWANIENFNANDKGMHPDQDFLILSWENRAVDLDDVIVANGFVLTGVRFKKRWSHLNFEVLATPFNFESGKLGKLSDSHWIDSWNTGSFYERRTKISLDRPDIPIRVHGPTHVDSKSNQFVEMTHTDFHWDAAQTTVPFFDAQPVESQVPVPLIGAGIYHKGTKNSGGFIAPKIVTYDYARNLRANDISID